MLSAESDSKKRVGISGIGMVTPCGADAESSWHGLVAGRSVLRWLTAAEHQTLGCDLSRTRIAGAPAVLSDEIQPLEASGLLDSMSHHAATEALADADLNLSDVDAFRRGIVLGTSKGSLAACQRDWLMRHQQAPSHSAWTGCWTNSPASTLAWKLDVRGAALAPVAACATGLLSICRGVELIQQGYCDVVLAGSVDDSLSEMIWASYRRLGVLASVRQTSPDKACRPFDQDRNGFLIGSGAAIVVLERMSDIEARGHRPYAEWLGGATLCDAHALTQVSPDAAGLTRLLQDALRQAHLGPRDIDYINLHGTGTRDNDRYETLGIRQAFGAAAERIPCSSLKGTIGHLLGAAGSVEFAATLLALRDGILPPTANLQHPGPECTLDYIAGHARTQPVDVALKLSLGFGGHLVAGVVRNCRR